jgi:hypothetical protein
MLAGTAARVLVIRAEPPLAFFVDWLYDRLAWALATGTGFTLDGQTPAAHVGPLYPATLAGLYRLVGHRPDLVPWLHVAFDLAAAACVLAAGRRLFTARTAALAAAAVYLYPAYWAYDARIRPEIFVTCLATAWLLLALRAAASGTPGAHALAGLAGGLATLAKPVMLPVALLLAALPLLDCGGPRRAWPRAAAALGACLLAVAPWTARNLQAFGLPVVVVSAGTGVGLWTGSDPVTGGSWPMAPGRETWLWESAGIAPLRHPFEIYEVPVDRRLGALGAARIRAHPARYAALTARRVVHLWAGNRLYLTGSADGLARGIARDAAARGPLVAAYSLAKRTLLVPAALVLAAWTAWRRRAGWRALAPVVAFPVGLTLAYAPLAVEAGRHVLPVLPCVFLLALAAFERRGAGPAHARSAHASIDGPTSQRPPEASATA